MSANHSTLDHATADHVSTVEHHFEDAGQQREAAEIGMWLFLITEFMFFGGLFTAYLVYRFEYPAGFAAGSHEMDRVLGAINTAVLLTSSLTMALAVHAAEHRDGKKTMRLLVATIVFGAAFLVVKAFEYHHKYHEHLIPFLPGFAHDTPENAGLKTFLNLYFLMTGLHALHMVIGIGVLATLAVWAARGGLEKGRPVVVHNTGLYWHFVDLVWVYLYPFFYLVAAKP